MFANGSLLAQVRPSASASTAFTTTLRTEVTRIVVVNTSGTEATFSIFHDDDGSTYDQTTALFYQAPINPKQTVEVTSDANGAGFHVARGGSIGVQTNVDLACTFSIYGVTEDLATR